MIFVHNISEISKKLLQEMFKINHARCHLKRQFFFIEKLKAMQSYAEYEMDN